jgi:hypothetical protein
MDEKVVVVTIDKVGENFISRFVSMCNVMESAKNRVFLTSNTGTANQFFCDTSKSTRKRK